MEHRAEMQSEGRQRLDTSLFRTRDSRHVIRARGAAGGAELRQSKMESRRKHGCLIGAE